MRSRRASAHPPRLVGYVCLAVLAVLRLLITRRWLLLLLAVVIVSVGCYKLGQWQFHRYDERHETNQQVRTNVAATPVALASVMTPTDAPSEDAEWTAVTVTGTYDPQHQLLVLYRTRDGAAGVEVVVPLITSDGSAVLVDRGFYQTDDTTGGLIQISLPGSNGMPLCMDAGSATPASGSAR